jgi:hypothetical protein
MQNLFRAGVVLSLVLSSAALIASVSGVSGPEAVAGAPRSNDLGPADALLLSTGAGKDPLRLAAKDGRIAWGDRSTDRAWSVAAVDVDAIMRKLLDAPSFADARKEAQEKAQADEAEFERRAQEIQSKAPADGAPPPPDVQMAWGKLQEEYGAWLEKTRTATEKLSADQFEQAYRELVVAVDAVSEKESIDVVFRFRPTSKPFEVERAGDAIVQIQSRTLLKYPEALDITPEVMKALNLS